MCSACCVGYIQTGKRQTTASKQADMSNFTFFPPLYLSLSLSFICLAGSFILTHRDTLSDWCRLMQTRGVNRKTESKQKENRETLLSLFMQPRLCGQMCTHEHVRVSTKHTGTNNHIVGSNQVCLQSSLHSHLAFSHPWVANHTRINKPLGVTSRQ